MMKERLDVLQYIIEYHVEHDMPPTYRSIAAEFGCSVRTAFVVVKRLEEENLIKKNLIAKGIKTNYVNTETS